MLIQEDVRSIISSKIHMAYCLYLADCLRPIASLYLEKGSLKYIGYELEILETLKDPELLCGGISEDALDSMIDDFDSLSDSDKDGIVEACIGYMQDHAIFDTGSSIITPFSEAYTFLRELMSNPKPIMNSGYIEKASKHIKDGIIEQTDNLKKSGQTTTSFFENPMYEYFFDRSMIFKTDDISNNRTSDLAPYPCIYREGNESHTLRDIFNFGLEPKSRISVLKNNANPKKPIVMDSVTKYDSSKSQWGKVGPTRTNEGVYPPPDGFDIFGDGDVDIITSRGKVLDLYDDVKKSSDYQNRKIGLPSLVVPKASIIISINNKNYDISFLIRRAGHSDIMNLRRRISTLLSERDTIDKVLSHNRRSDAPVEKNKVLENMVLKIDDTIDALYSRVSNFSMEVNTNLMNKISGRDLGNPISDSSKETYSVKSLPCITEVDFYTAYWLITNPDSAPHPYVSEEDQADLLTYLFESANLEPIMNSLVKSGHIGSTRISDLRPDILYSLDSIADISVLSSVRGSHEDANSFSIGEAFPGKNVDLKIYSDEADSFGGHVSDLSEIKSFSVNRNIRVHDGKNELVTKIHRMFSDDVVNSLKESQINIVSDQSKDMVRFHGDYAYSDGATFGRYYDIISDDLNKSSITYSMASLDIDSLLDELVSFKRDLGTRSKPSVGDMTRIQEVLVLLTYNLKDYANKNYVDSMDALEYDYNDSDIKFKSISEKLISLVDKNKKLKKGLRSDDITDRPSLEKEQADVETHISLLRTEKNKVKKISDELEIRLINRNALLDGNRFGGVWPGVWLSGQGKKSGDSSILFNAAKDLIFNEKFDLDRTILEHHLLSTGKGERKAGQPGDAQIESISAKDWVLMLEELCHKFNINPNSNVLQNYYTRISDVFDSTKSSESLRIYVNKIVSNTHAVWHSESTSGKTRAIRALNIIGPGNPYEVFDKVSDYLGINTPSLDKNSPYEQVHGLYLMLSKELNPDKPESPKLNSEMHSNLISAFNNIKLLRAESNRNFVGSIVKRSVREDIFWRIINASRG
jgi:hypothetical protein